MNVEENRLRTFTDWPANAAVDAARIAKAGFYYTGHGLEVQCFLCGTKISDWNYGDQAIVRHRQAQPNCPFIQNPIVTSNVPLVPNSVVTPDTASSSPLGGGNRMNRSPSLLSAIQSREPRREYGTYTQRLGSFSNWPISTVVSPERLARAGFYYLQQADMVECVYCKGIVMKWEPGDDPDREHRMHFPNCDFYIQRDNEDDQVELANVTLMPGAAGDLRELGIQTHIAPRRPKHATYEGRLRTFQGWPEDVRPTPEMLATAGFYYTGVSDQVRCFHCDGGLSNWDTNDDAWTEHARWFPKCGFVNLVQGQKFVKQCVDNRPPLDPSILVGVAEDENTDVSARPPPPLPTASPPTQPVTETVLEQLLNTPPARAALEIGLQVGRVKRALKRRMEDIGVPYTSADQLIEDVLHDQHLEEETRLDQTPDSPSRELSNLLNQVITREILNTSGNSESTETQAETNSDDATKENANDTKDSKNSDDKGNEKRVDEGENKSEEKGANEVKNKSDEKAATLEEENRRLKEARLCKICMDREIGVVFLPCGHLSTCSLCAPSLTDCPMCRHEIRATVRTFLS